MIIRMFQVQIQGHGRKISVAAPPDNNQFYCMCIHVVRTMYVLWVPGRVAFWLKVPHIKIRSIINKKDQLWGDSYRHYIQHKASPS